VEVFVLFIYCSCRSLGEDEPLPEATGSSGNSSSHEEPPPPPPPPRAHKRRPGEDDDDIETTAGQGHGDGED
jgi:hypothetical protein